MSLAGGLLMGYWVSKGDPFWTYSSGLAGIITASAGNDLYHPLQAMIIGAIGVFIMYKMHYWLERRFKIDDAVGAVAVHGYAGVVGLLICGFMLWGYPSSAYEGYAAISPWGDGHWCCHYVRCAWVLAELDYCADSQQCWQTAHPAGS
jgi:ammonia channel protein AmtB